MKYIYIILLMLLLSSCGKSEEQINISTDEAIAEEIIIDETNFTDLSKAEQEAEIAAYDERIKAEQEAEIAAYDARIKAEQAAEIAAYDARIKAEQAAEISENEALLMQEIENQDKQILKELSELLEAEKRRADLEVAAKEAAEEERINRIESERLESSE